MVNLISTETTFEIIEEIDSSETILLCPVEIATGASTLIAPPYTVTQLPSCVLVNEQTNLTPIDLGIIPTPYRTDEIVDLVPIETWDTAQVAISDEDINLVLSEAFEISILVEELVVLEATTDITEVVEFLVPLALEDTFLIPVECSYVKSTLIAEPHTETAYPYKLSVDEQEERLNAAELSELAADIPVDESALLDCVEVVIRDIGSAETVFVSILEAFDLDAMSRPFAEVDLIKAVHGKSLAAEALSLEQIRLDTLEATNTEIDDGIRRIGSAELGTIETIEVIAGELNLDLSETSSLIAASISDCNSTFARAISDVRSTVDYTLEVRKRNINHDWDLLGIIDQKIEPSIERETNMADMLTFSMLQSDPKIKWFTAGGSVHDIEIWYYGRDGKLKQVFVVQDITPSRTLDSGELDKLTITADGPEYYLTTYQIGKTYKVMQKPVFDILAEICGNIIVDGYLTDIFVDPALNKSIDIDLSWENLKTACDKIIDQIGGRVQVYINPLNTKQRAVVITKGVLDAELLWWGTSMGGITDCTPAAVARDAGCIDLFATGTDHSVWLKSYYDNTWQGWKSLGGVALNGTSPATCSWGANRLDVFVTGTDKAVWHRYNDTMPSNAWSAWDSHGGQTTGSPTAVSWDDGRIDLFVRGTDSHLRHLWWNGTQWGSWEDLGGILLENTSPSAASIAANSLDILTAGTDKQIWDKKWASKVWSWGGIGGQTESTPGATGSNGMLHVFVRGLDGNLFYKYRDSIGWSSWEPIDGEIAAGTGPAACSYGSTINVFVVRADHQIWQLQRAVPAYAMTVKEDLKSDCRDSVSGMGLTFGRAEAPSIKVTVLTNFTSKWNEKISVTLFNSLYGDIQDLYDGYIGHIWDDNYTATAVGNCINHMHETINAVLAPARLSYKVDEEDEEELSEESIWADWLPVGTSTVDKHIPIITYDTFPPVLNKVQNTGSLLGSEQWAEGNSNGHTVLKSGATAWTFNTDLDADFLRIPYGQYIDNLFDVTISLCVYIGTQTANVCLFSKKQEYGAFELIYDYTNKRIKLSRGTSDSNVDEWATENDSVLPEDWYHIQVILAGESPNPNTPPIIYVDNELQTLTNTIVGTGTFSYDYGNDIYLGNDEDLTKTFNGILSHFKLYNSAITETLQELDYLHNAWRRDPQPSNSKIVYELFPAPNEPV